jgi:hypothetical protein
MARDFARVQVYLRLKTPLLTLMASASSEVAFCVLSHVLLLIKRCPGVFDDEFKQFFCGYAAFRRFVASPLCRYIGCCIQI